MALREILVELGFKVDKSGEKKASSSLDKLKKGALALGAVFAAGKLAQGVASFVDQMRVAGDVLDKTSQQVGLTTEALQELSFAAGLAGVDSQAMAQSLGILQKNAVDATRGSKKMAEDFQKLGINVKDSSGNLKTADILLSEFAEGISNLDNETEKVALSLNLMGRTGKRLLPLFADGAAGVADMRDEFRELGGGMSKDAIAASVRLTDDMLRLETVMMGLKSTIAEFLLPIFNDLVLRAIEFAKTMRGPVNQAVQTMRRFKRALENLAPGIDLMKVMQVLLGTLTVALAAVAAAALVAGLKIAAGWIIGMAPLILMLVLIGALAAAVILLAEDFLAMGEDSESVTGTMIKGVTDLIEQWGGVGPAIGAMLDEALRFWLGFFGVAEDEVDEWIDNLTQTLEEMWTNVIDFWLGALKSFVSKAADLLNPFGIGRAIAAALDFSGGGATAAAPTAGTVTPAGGASMVNQPSTEVNVSIDASGTTASAEDIAGAAAKVMRTEQERQNRQTAQAFAVATGGA